MNLFFTKKFIRLYRKLPIRIQKTTDKQLELLLSDPQHPSLNIKKMKNSRDIWETRVTKNYRFLFLIKKDTYILRKIGTHNILKKH